MTDETIVAKLVRLGWSEPTLAVWRRAGYRCEYCGADLLLSADAYLYGSHRDHVVPNAGDDLENLALACKACNFIKRDRDFAVPDKALTRDELVALAKEYIRGVRLRNEQRLSEVRELLAELPSTQSLR